jgi:uroporphyrinogen decarboxylase
MSAGKGGGYVLTSSNSVQLGVPPENYLAMLEALRDYGRYPLTGY